MNIESFDNMVVISRRRSFFKSLLILLFIWTVLFGIIAYWNGHDVKQFIAEKKLQKFELIFTKNNENFENVSELADSDVEDELEESEESFKENDVKVDIVEIETTILVTTKHVNETTNATMIEVFLPPMEALSYGELGKPVLLPANISQDVRNKINDGWARMAFNEYVSDLISIKRTLPDVRFDLCKNKVYLDNLPATSVILCFHNEAWSTLLRSVHSILDRSPEHLITEIILVDDFSDLGKIIKL